MHSIVTLFSAVALILFIIFISLLFMLSEEWLLHRRRFAAENIEPKNCRYKYRLYNEGHFPHMLMFACLSLVAVALFIPMGTLPQFISTIADLFIMVFLLLIAHTLYMKGIKSFYKERYQSLEKKEINLFLYFSAALLFVGGTLSWYVLNRGMPGHIFSIDAYSAMPLWNNTDYWGKIALFFFFILLSSATPIRRESRLCENGEITLLEIFEALSLTVSATIIAAIFLPHKLAIRAGITGMAMYSLDFLSFWVEVFIIQIIILPIIKKCYASYEERFYCKLRLLPLIFMGLIGLLFMMIDLYF